MKTKSLILFVPAILLTINAYATKQVLVSTPKNLPQAPSNIYEPIPDLAQFILPASTQAAEISQGARFFSLALQAWNPSLNPNDVERIINRHIENQGLMKGLIEPALALIDTSYAAGRPEFGNMMNPMLKRLSTPLAEGLHRQYGLPLEFTGRNFENVMKLNDRDILSSMQKVLGDEFKRNQPQPLTINDNSDFMAQAILGKSSFLGFASRNLNPNQMRNGDEGAVEPKGFQPKKDFSSTPRQTGTSDNAPQTGFKGKPDRSSTPRSSSEEREERPKGLFSKLDLLSYGAHACAAKCVEQIVTLNAATIAAGAGIGMIYGSITGATIGVFTGAVIGTTAGGFACSQSNECNPTPQKSDTPSTVTPKEPSHDTNGGTPKSPSENSDAGHNNPEPKKSDSGTPSTPKDPNSDDTGDDDDGDSSDEDNTTLSRFLEDRKIPGIDFEKKEERL